MTKPLPNSNHKFKCNLCPLAFDSPQKMGAHKRNAHPGQPLRPKEPTTPSVPVTPLQCPECKGIFPNTRNLGLHRRQKHGIPGKTAESNKAYEERRKLRMQEKANGAQLVTVPRQERTPSDEQPKEHENHRHIPTNDTLALALTVGQLEERCRNLAEEHGIPTKFFTRQVAELFYKQTRR